MNQLDAMQVFLKVADLASFTEAAQQLGLPKASVSTAVQSLEALLGTRLLHRTTRRVQLTQDGQVARERCRDLLADVEELRTLFQGPGTGAALTGRLRVDMPHGVLRQLVMPNLPAFLAAHPLLSIELSSTDRRVDLVREGFDCVLRVGTVTDGNLIARPLGHYRLLNCASPAYLAAFGTPQTLADLAGHRLVHYTPALGTPDPGFEHVDAATGQVAWVPMAGSLSVNNSEAYQAACLAGLGIVQAPEVGVRALLDQGLLVAVLPEHLAAPMPVSLLYANRRHLPKRVQVFMDWVAEVMRGTLDRQIGAELTQARAS
jgi:DNA-binding transcriptional LysR family regulator